MFINKPNEERTNKREECQVKSNHTQTHIRFIFVVSSSCRRQLVIVVRSLLRGKPLILSLSVVLICALLCDEQQQNLFLVPCLCTVTLK
jgi:hypothetical protein